MCEVLEMKRVLAIILTLALTLCLTACNEKGTDAASVTEISFGDTVHKNKVCHCFHCFPIYLQ